MSTLSTRTVMLATSTVILAGCAATTGEGHILTEDARAAAAATSCCKAVTELLAEAVPLPVSAIALSPVGRHFAFPSGLAPYAVFRIGSPTGPAELSLLSHWRQRGWVEGGDGMTHFANTLALFFDDQGRLVPSPVVAKQQVATTEGRALQKRFAIPQGAQYVIVTTDPRQTGTVESSTVSGQRDLPLVSGRTLVFLPGGVLPADYRLTTYGPVSIQVRFAFIDAK